MRRPCYSTLSSFSSLLTVWLLGVFAVAGCEPGFDQVEVGSREQAIVNGVDDSADLNVGLLHSGGSNACTATLIGPRTLLTAAHCVAKESAPHTLLSPVNYYPDGFSGKSIKAEWVAVHPNFDGPNKADLAIVRLSESINITPAQIAGTAPVLGEAVDLLGFGRTSESSADFGTRRTATALIGNVDAQTIQFTGSAGGAGNLCNGDSGGPTFAIRDGKLNIIGVHSSKGGSCGQSGTDLRVDAFVAWILEAAQGDVTAPPSWSPRADSPGVSGQASATAEDQAASATQGCNMTGADAAPLGVMLGLLLSLAGIVRRVRRKLNG